MCIILEEPFYMQFKYLNHKTPNYFNKFSITEYI